MKILTIIAKVGLLLASLSLFIFILVFLIVDKLGGNTESQFFAIFNKIPFILLPLLIIFYLLNLFRDQTIEKTKKIIWTYLLIAGSYLVFPAYWYNHIWRAKKDQQIKSNVKAGTDGSKFRTKPHTPNLAKILLLIFSFLPILFGGSSIFLAFSAHVNIWTYVLGASAYASVIVLMIIYTINTFKNPRVRKDQRALWIVALVLINIVVFPFYWYFYIWNKPKDQTSA